MSYNVAQLSEAMAIMRTKDVQHLINRIKELEAKLVWQPMETAPKDRDILVWHDHESDPYYDPNDPDKLTDYAVWCEIHGYLDYRGLMIAKWLPQQFETVDEYGGGINMPAWWHVKSVDDYEMVCNPTHWMPLPQEPEGDKP